MSKTLSDYISQVNFFIEEDGLSIEDAIQRVKVPDVYFDKIKADIEKLINFKPEITSIISSEKLIEFIDPDLIYKTDLFGSFLKHIYDNRNWGQDVCISIKNSTEQIISNIPEPNQLIKFTNLGLIVGYVQSGKTANMAGVIARCIDSGYKVVIVLAGILNNLRSQTQQRFDKDILAYGKSGECVNHSIEIVRFTSERINGDFQDSPQSLDRNKPNVFIIKKHPAVIEKLKIWLKNDMKSHNLDYFPCIIIDDEADQASINTNYDKYDDGNKIDPSKTNEKIRDLLKLFPKCVYVGYTATPFANILIDANEEDLYPKDFIAVLPEPIGYMGTRKIFGLGMSPSTLSDENIEDPDFDVVRYIDEDDLTILENLSTNLECPESLRIAIISFFISSACRFLRGHEKDHYSMLVHISYKIANHQLISDIIDSEVKFLKLVFQDKSGTFNEITKLIKDVWENFILTTKNISSHMTIFTFDQIITVALKIIEEIEVLSLHSGSVDSLDYTGKPRRYIIIGGNKLSRGLTLEGLSVSYFTRTSKTYDTLLQMGRWFGFRTDYEDLTRLFVSEDNFNNFKDLARVEVELREDLKKFSKKDIKVSPKDIFPIIRNHPALAVTSQSKFGAGKITNISYSGMTSETVNFYFNDIDKLLFNQTIVSDFLMRIGAPHKKGIDGTFFWMDISYTEILNLLKMYSFSPDSRTVNGGMLSMYISKQVKNQELVKWDIVIPKGNKKCDTYKWCENINTHMINRGRFNNTSIKVLRDPADIKNWKETLGRVEDCVERGTVFFYVINKLSYDGDFKKQLFKVGEQGENIIGLLFKFPLSFSYETAEYISQG